MTFSEMRPFVRFAQSLRLNQRAFFDEVVALDARLFFVQDGCGKIRADGKDYLLKKNDLLIINAGIPYHIFPTESETTYLQVNFDYNQNAAAHDAPILPVRKGAFKEDMLINPVSFDDRPGLNRILFLENAAALQKWIYLIISEFSHRLAFSKEKESHLLAACLIDAVRTHQSILMNGEDKISAKVISFIHENFQKPLTNASIGAHFSYHPNYVSDLIKSTTGLPLHQYLIHVRLIKAVSLLQNTSLSVSEVALACGFCDAAYFSGYFKRAFRVSPSKFRSV